MWAPLGRGSSCRRERRRSGQRLSRSSRWTCVTMSPEAPMSVQGLWPGSFRFAGDQGQHMDPVDAADLLAIAVDDLHRMLRVSNELDDVANLGTERHRAAELLGS